MAEVVIVGGGIGGLSAALLLGRQGRGVVVCEKDAAPVPGSPDEMWSSWARPGIPQAPLGHTFLPGFRKLLSARAPDVVERVLTAGAQLVDFSLRLPGERRPEDAEMTAIMCRRAVLEGTLRHAVAAEPTVELRCGCDVAGLVAEPSSMPGVPRVTGIRTRNGGGIPADTVIIATGRTGHPQQWLEGIGVEPLPELSEGCGLVCFTRFFQAQLRPGEDNRITTSLTIEGDPGYMLYEIFGADRATFCVEFLPPAWDQELRGLRHEAVHMAAARMLPEIADWLDADRATPIGPVTAMGRERNVLRRFLRDARPLALGLHVIGDARCQVNSAYAWGCALALASAAALADLLAEHPGDFEAQALAFEERMGPELAGRHRFSMARDRALERAFRGEQAWTADKDDEAAFIEGTILPAATEDPEIFRAARRWDLQLDAVGALSENGEIHARARELARRRQPEAHCSPGPTRESLLALIAALAPA